jgi:Tol biopolymer transport system component/DNA-binding winged helix-turn-helix (wHTH) protein
MAVIGDSGTRTIQFGIFEVDLRAGELRRNGSRVKLQEQPLQILTLLLEHQGEVVTREELRQKLWPADTFVDFDHSLNAAIRRLRDALGDSAENPRYVETVARRGYRFLTAVNGAQPAAAAALSPSGSNQSASQQPASKNWRTVAVAAVLLIGVTAGWIVSRRWVHHSSVQIRQQRLTANPEDDPVAGAVISPDGKYLAFSDNTGFYLREIDGGETHAVSLATAIAAVPAAWYADGTHLIAKGVEGPKAPPSLWQISIVGGTARKLIDDARSPVLSPDGSQILFVRGPATEQEIWLMQADGGKPRRIVAGDRSMIISPTWSPDGRKIAYVTGNYEPEIWQTSTRVEIFDLATGRKETILSAVSLRPGLVWTTDGRLIYAVSEPPPNQNDSNIWAARLGWDGHIYGPASRLTATTGDVAAMSASADGKRLAYTKHWLQPDVYVAELNPAGTRLSTPKRLTLDERNDFPFAWTPDSKAVLFSSDRDGAYHIYKQAIDQSVPERLALGDEQAMAPRLTPDGASVLYVIWPKVGEIPAAGGLMRVPLAGGPPQAVVKQDAIGNVQCTRLPSALCIYDVRKMDQMSFFKFDPASGKSEELPQLSVHDEPSYAYNWSLSPDGKILATSKREGWAMGDYSSQRAPSITFVSVADGSKRTVTVPAWAGLNSIDWAVDGRSLWAPVYTNTGTWALLKIDLQGRATTVLEDTRMTIGWAIPAPDGKHLALWKASGSSNVWMLERF